MPQLSKNWAERAIQPVESVDGRAARQLEMLAKDRAAAHGLRMQLVGKVVSSIVVLALLSAGAVAAADYFGAYKVGIFPQRMPPAQGANDAAPDASQAGTDQPAFTKLILAPSQPQEPATAVAPLEPEPAPTVAANDPRAEAHRAHLQAGLGIMGRELAETDGAIAGCKAALYVRPWSPRGGRPAPWTDCEHLVELEAYAANRNMAAREAWDWKVAHDAWVAIVGNDRRRMAELNSKRASLTGRMQVARAQMIQ